MKLHEKNQGNYIKYLPLFYRICNLSAIFNHQEKQTSSSLVMCSFVTLDKPLEAGILLLYYPTEYRYMLSGRRRVSMMFSNS